MKSTFIVIALILLPLLSSCYSMKYYSTEGYSSYSAAKSRAKEYGAEDPEVVRLITIAKNQFEKDLEDTKSSLTRIDIYDALVYILLYGPKQFRDNERALRLSYDKLELMESYKDRNFHYTPSYAYYDIGFANYRLGDYYTSLENIKKSNNAGMEALFYLFGLGTEQDLPKAMELFRKSALAGDDSSWASIYGLEYQINEYKKGNYNNEGMTLFMEYLYLIAMDEAKDVWMSKLTQAADLSYPLALIDLWILFRNDKQVGKGMSYLQKAVEADYVPAFTEMGMVYSEGLNNTIVNYIEAKKWFEKAAAEGVPVAQHNLGWLYYKNYISAEKGSSNQDMAYYWFNAAAEQGYTPSIYNLNVLKGNVTAPSAAPSNVETAKMVLKTVNSIINASTAIYKSINKSNVQCFIPPNRSAAQNTSSSTSGNTTSRNTIGQLCPLCHGDGKCSYQSYLTGLNSCKGGKLDCSVCRGKGTVDATGGTKICSNCKGAKQVQCGVCHGTGKCGRCGGTGRI